jgi:YD repeat-containing protein
MIRDPQNRLMAALDAVGLPSSLVFDAHGRLVAAHTGEISRAALTRMIAQATGEGR